MLLADLGLLFGLEGQNTTPLSNFFQVKFRMSKHGTQDKKIQHKHKMVTCSCQFSHGRRL